MSMPEETKRVRRKKKTKRVLKLPKIIFILVLLWFFGHAMYSFVLNSLIQTEFVTLGSIEKKHEVKAFILKDEYVINAPSSGTIKNIFPEGEKIAKNKELYAIKTVKGNALENEEEISVKSPISGLVSYNVDGLESDFSMEELSKLNLENIANLNTKNIDDNKNDLVKEGKAVCKIIDNLKGIRCYLEYPLEIFDKHLQKGDQLQIRFPKYDNEIFVTISDFRKDKTNAQILVQIPQMCYSLMNERVVDVEIITKRTQGILIPLKAIVTDEKNNKGVYLKNKGTVLWRPIEVMETDKDRVLIEGIDPLTEVIINPKWVRKGQNLY